MKSLGQVGMGRAAGSDSGVLSVGGWRQTSFLDSVWLQVKDGNDTARAIFDNHYSRYRYVDGRSPLLFVGPGEKMVLVTPDAFAVFAWRKFIDDSGQVGVNCAIFRNEAPRPRVLDSSDLIRAATENAWGRWPGERLYTYVNDAKIRRKRDPGRCFLRAGWQYVRDESGARARTKSGLLVLECLPSSIPHNQAQHPERQAQGHEVDTFRKQPYCSTDKADEGNYQENE